MRLNNHLFILLSIGLHNEVDNPVILDVNWDDLIKLALKHGVAGQVFYGVKRLKENNVPNGRVEIDVLDFGHLFTITNRLENSFISMWDKTVRLANLFYENNIRTIVIKGFGIAALYPNSKARNSCDLDCYLLPKVDSEIMLSIENDINDNKVVWEQANKIIEQKGINVKRSIYLHSVFNYDGLLVENHRYFTNVKGNRKMREFESYLHTLIKKNGLKTFPNTNIEVPTILFTALYVLYHSHKHMLYGEMTLKMICDWAVILKECSNRKFEWDEFWSVCQKYGLYRFAVAITGLTENICNAPVPKDFKHDFLAEDTLYKFVMNPVAEVKHYSWKWLARLNHLYFTIKSRDKFIAFSDISSTRAAWDIIKGRIYED